MFRRQRSGAVVCPSCGRLVGVTDDRCLNCGRRNPGMWGFTGLLRGLGDDMGFVQLVMGGTILLYAATLVTGGVQMGGSLFSLFSPSQTSLYAFGASGAVPVFGLHRWWTVLSAGWLHAGVLHILFNLLWVRQLAPETAELYGPGRMVILYTVASATGFLLSSLVGAFLPFLGGARLTVGASAPIFGLLAALVYYGRRSGSRLVGNQAWSYAVVLFVFGFILRGVDNWAHLGGFAGGYLTAKWMDPLRPERGDHLLAAVACLAATALAIVASLVTSRL
ncbi:MAG TPA: rhomboid family intramembrane serine protease [Thermoanaerobaculia bacterium]|nr:rhomboid family intramembrane serine protease [Thermoanaerobaculia bacterium]